jgi:hypothetical protein
MTMHPDNHAPHPARRFDDEDIYMPPKPSRISMTLAVKPRYRTPSRARLLAWALLEAVCVLFAFAAFGFAALVFLADDRTRAAWGLWFRNLIGL